MDVASINATQHMQFERPQNYPKRREPKTLSFSNLYQNLAKSLVEDNFKTSKKMYFNPSNHIGATKSPTVPKSLKQNHTEGFNIRRKDKINSVGAFPILGEKAYEPPIATPEISHQFTTSEIHSNRSFPNYPDCNRKNSILTYPPPLLNIPHPPPPKNEPPLLPLYTAPSISEPKLSAGSLKPACPNSHVQSFSARTQEVLKSHKWDPANLIQYASIPDQNGEKRRFLVKHYFISTVYASRILINDLNLYIQNPFGSRTIIKDFVTSSPLGAGTQLSVLVEEMEGTYGDMLDLNTKMDNISALKTMVDQLITQLEAFHVATNKGHFDIKPGNLLRDEHGNLRLGDFLGRIKYMKIYEGMKSLNIKSLEESNKKLSMLLENRELLIFLAPEIKESLSKLHRKANEALKTCNNHNPTQALKQFNDYVWSKDWSNYSMQRADIYSAGACLYYLLAKIKGLDNPLPSKGRISLKKLNGFPPLLINLLHGMLRIERSKRLNILQCSAHPFLWSLKDQEIYLANIAFQLLNPSEHEHLGALTDTEILISLNESFDQFTKVLSLYPHLQETSLKILDYSDTIPNVNIFKKSVQEKSKLGILLLLSFTVLSENLVQEQIHDIIKTVTSKYPEILLQSLDFFLYPKIHDSSIALGTTNKLPFLNSIDRIKQFVRKVILPYHPSTIEFHPFVKEVSSDFKDRKGLHPQLVSEQSPDKKHMIKNTKLSLTPPSQNTNSKLCSSILISAVPPPSSFLKERATRNAVLDPHSWFPNGRIPDHLKWYGEVTAEEFEAWLEEKFPHEDDISTHGPSQSTLFEISETSKQTQPTQSNEISDNLLDNSIEKNNHDPQKEVSSAKRYSILFLARGTLLYRHFSQELQNPRQNSRSLA